MPATPVRYRSPEEDSDRWTRFRFRPGDIVISTRSKSGTTWMQMICALLVFRSPDLPRPLGEISPWLDWLVTPEAAVYERLDRQTHRRFIKTHTPLDGLPIDARVTYVVVARHPLDAAASLHHQADNIDRDRLRELTGQPAAGHRRPRPPLPEWLHDWVNWDGDRRDQMDSLPGMLWHLSGAWARRSQSNVVLVHYDDLLADLDAEMRRIAARLGFDVAEEAWPALVAAATLDAMRRDADKLVPAGPGVLKDASKFFRRGRSGQGREAAAPDDLARYHQRARDLAPADLLAWLHRARPPPAPQPGAAV